MNSSPVNERTRVDSAATTKYTDAIKNTPIFTDIITSRKKK